MHLPLLLRMLLLAAAQCAHAAVGVVENLRKHDKKLLHQWELWGAAKIAVKCPSQQLLVGQLLLRHF